MGKTADVAVGICLDESGSMNGCRQQTITGLTDYLKQLRKQEGKTTVTLTKFSDLGPQGKFRVQYENKPLTKGMGLTDATYTPNGNTPLFDAIGHTITLMDAHVAGHPDVNPMVVIQTDGYENASIDYTRDQIVRMIRKREKRGWVFVFLGANMTDARAAEGAMLLGLAASASMGYTGQTSDAAFASVGDSTVSLRNARVSGTYYDSSMAGSEMKASYVANVKGGPGVSTPTWTNQYVVPTEPGNWEWNGILGHWVKV